jgi:FkbM family methyltransferase
MILDLVELTKKYNMNIQGVIHIGAHFGEENGVYNQLKIKNRIYFEPNSKNFGVLKQNLGDKYNLIQKALGNENKKMTMFVETANSGQSNSLLKPSLHLYQYPHIQFTETEDVDMVRIDDIGLDLLGFNFINIDVQGYELEVFKGAENTLKNIDYIMSEINRDEVYENCARIEELINFLSPYGFKLVETDWAGNSWGDGLFIKEK